MANIQLTSSESSSDIFIRKITLDFFMVAFIISTAIANILICVAFGMVRLLRKPQHYLVVSLAGIDLAVAILMIPTMMYEILGEWIFGKTFCDLWICFHQMCVTASIYNLCALSLDRYWKIMKPLRYVNRASKRMILTVLITWLSAASVSLPPLIFGNVHLDTKNNPICLIYQNVSYQTYAAVAGFCIPFVVTMCVYYKIYRAARKITAEMKHARHYIDGLLNEPRNEPNYSTKTSIIRLCVKEKKCRFTLAKHYKATTILGFLVFTFAICWLPYYVLALARLTIDDDYTVLNDFSLLFLWLGFLNSLLDPIINATMHQDFRKSIRELLCCRCSKLNVAIRDSYYQRSFATPRCTDESVKFQSSLEEPIT